MFDKPLEQQHNEQLGLHFQQVGDHSSALLVSFDLPYLKGLLQDLPMNKQALEYVLEKARVDNVAITQEQGRQSLGALGLSGQMALARIGMVDSLFTA